MFKFWGYQCTDCIDTKYWGEEGKNKEGKVEIWEEPPTPHPTHTHMQLDPTQVAETLPLLFLSALSEQGDEGLYLRVMDVLLQEFIVVVHESRNGVLCKNTVANLALHRPKKLVCYFFLRGRERVTITYNCM